MQNIEESISKLLGLIENRNTRITYSGGLDYFVESLRVPQDEAVSSLSVKDFVHFVEWIAEKELTVATKNLHVSAMKKLINYWVVNGLIEFSYADEEKIKQAVKLYIGKARKLPKVASHAAVERMMRTVFEQKIYSPIKERDIALIIFLATSGCRRSEVVNLKVSNIDIDTCSVMIYSSKGNKDRRIIISPDTCDAVTNYWEARGSANPRDPVFARHDKKSHWREKLTPMSGQGIYLVIDRIRKLAGVPEGMVTPHSFRHYCATKLAHKNIKLAQEQLGHASPVTTGKYIHFSQSDLAEAHKEVFA